MAAAEPFSIRGFAARMRAEDADECWLLGARAELQTETSLPLPLPPMDPPPRSRWWAHELAAVRARLDACAAGGDAAVGGGAGNGGGLGRTTKRKGSRGSAVAERANKRQRALQLRHKVKEDILRIRDYREVVSKNL